MLQIYRIKYKLIRLRYKIMNFSLDKRKSNCNSSWFLIGYFSENSLWKTNENIMIILKFLYFFVTLYFFLLKISKKKKYFYI